jgi:RNA polymerase sigma factor (sigma-70 family)
VDYVPHPSFRRPETEERLFGKQVEEIEIPAWYPLPEKPADAARPPSERVKLTAGDEERVFLRYNYARFRLSKLAEAQRARPTLVRAKEMVLWYRRVIDIRAELVPAYMPLVVAMARRRGAANVEFAELIGEGNLALLRSVEKFDVARGFRFSTYACCAILKSFKRLSGKTQRYHVLFPTQYDPELDRSDHDVMGDEMRRRDWIESLRELLAGNRARLTPMERTVLEERFALGARGRRQTLAAVGEMVGLTCERVRQIQKAALGKLRAALEDCAIAS